MRFKQRSPKRHSPLIVTSLLLGATILLSACGDDTQDASQQAGSGSNVPVTGGNPVSSPADGVTDPQEQVATNEEGSVDTLIRVENLADSLHNAALMSARTLAGTVQTLTSVSDENTADTAKSQWRETHQAVLWLEALYSHPATASIPRQVAVSAAYATPDAESEADDMEGIAAPQYSLASTIDQIPLQPGYLDTVPGYPASGLVHALDQPITLQTLSKQHQFADPEFLIYGLHPLEAMLWRSPAMDGSDAEQLDTVNSRRLQLMRLQASELVESLEQLQTSWREQQAALGLVQPYSNLSDNHPSLQAAMSYLDAHFVEGLEGLPEYDTTIAGYHLQHNAAPEHYWQGRLQGLDTLLEIIEINTGFALRMEPVQKQISELKACLLNLPVQTLTNLQEDAQSRMQCSDIALRLREKIVIRFAQGLSTQPPPT